jgi:hypothetical protein
MHTRFFNAAGIREKVVSKLEELTEMSESAVRTKLFEALEALEPLGVLQDRNGNGVSPDDILVNISTANRSVEVEFTLAGSHTFSQPINDNFGLDGLGLEVRNANLNLEVTLERFKIGFGVSAADGFYLLTGANNAEPELKVSVTGAVSAPSGDLAELEAELGFLTFTAKDTEFTVDGTTKRSNIHGEFTLDLRDPRRQADVRRTPVRGRQERAQDAS